MVAVVHEAVGHRVMAGFLGCPECDSRFSIEDGTVHLVCRDAPEPQRDPPVFSLPRSDETAVLVGAVLDLARGTGYVLLGPGLAAIADAVAALAEGWEVVLLTGDRPGEAPDSTHLSPVVVSDGMSVPVLRGRFGAAALAGDPGTDRVSEVAAAVRPLGRIAIVAPGPGAVPAMRDAGLEVFAADQRVAVASRRP